MPLSDHGILLMVLLLGGEEPQRIGIHTDQCAQADGEPTSAVPRGDGKISKPGEYTQAHITATTDVTSRTQQL